MKRHFQYFAMLLLAAMWSAGVHADGRAALVEAARDQVGRTLHYDPSYRHLDYPNGDVPMDRGVCTDVIIRAMRAALRLDLQRLVHEDMRDHFSRYPNRWGLRRPDRSIDHRRVPNLQTYFKRQGWALRVSREPDAFLPGDIVTCTVPPHLPHIMIVSNRKAAGGRPLVIHNIGMGAQEEDILFDYPITGHYRIDLAGVAAAGRTADGFTDRPVVVE